MYRNPENYSDPTAGKALAAIVREERRKKPVKYEKVWVNPKSAPQPKKA